MDNKKITPTASIYDAYQKVIVLAYSDAQKEATARYNKKAYDRIDVIVKKGQRQVIKDFAASQGKSLNRFICDAIEYQMSLPKQANE